MSNVQLMLPVYEIMKNHEFDSTNYLETHISIDRIVRDRYVLPMEWNLANAIKDQMIRKQRPVSCVANFLVKDKNAGKCPFI